MIDAARAPREFVVRYESMPITAATAEDAIAKEGNGGGHWNAEDVALAEPRTEYDYRVRAYHDAAGKLGDSAYSYLVAITRSHWPDATRLVLHGQNDEYGELRALVDEVHLPRLVLTWDHPDDDARAALDDFDDATRDVRSYLASVCAEDYLGRTEIDLP